MLNEERIKLMTQMASYEDNDGKKNVAIGSYFRGDYISLQVMKAVISATMAFGIICAMYVFYDFETFMQNIYKIDLLVFGKKILLLYVIFVAVYALLSYIIYAYRYNKARASLKRYYNHLKELSAMYGQEGKK
ncbi:MAG: hypothetical protein IJ485_02980 [Lachnospiraceae bacterium]|nr:hypothetical protein [Lachnospiraceae bacterium]